MRIIARTMAESRPEGALLITPSNAGLPGLAGGAFISTGSPDDVAAISAATSG